MWELRNSLSRGRISLRRFSLLVTSVLMAFFVATIMPGGIAFADGATRSGDDLVYQGRTFTPAPQEVIDSIKPAGAPANTSGYYVQDQQGGKAHFIYTAGPGAEAKKGFYVSYDFTPPKNFTNPSAPVDIEITEGAATTDGPTSNCADSVTAGIGWIVCPVTTFLAKGMDMLYNIISGFMAVTTVTNDTSSSLYKLWSIVRDIANICFVIAFLVIVYSQITSVGISNYGIKNMLPRLIIAAILVNVSYWICALAVDASNILGSSIHNLFTAIMDKINTGSQYNNVTVPSWEIITAAVLSGGALTAGIGIAIAAHTFTGAIFLLIPFLVGVILAALVALIILAARQALITCLVIISPLAMVAYLLPNTEKLFEKWRSAMMTLLLLFPIFSVIFSGAQLAGLAIIQNAGGSILTIILGMAVQVAPIVVTPMLVKFSGGVISKIAGIVNNPNKGLIDRTRNWSQGMAEERKNKVLAGQTKHFNGRLRKLHAATRALDNRRRYRDGRRKSYEARADNRFAATKYGQAVEAMNRDAANDKQRIENHFADSARGRQLELQARHLGAHKQEIENSLLRSENGKRLTERQHLAEIDKTRVSNEFEQSQYGQRVDRAKRVAESQKKRIENTHQANWDTAIQTDPGLKELELSVKASEVKSVLAKGQVDAMHAEILAKGGESEHVLNLRGVSADTQERVINIARDIKKDGFDAQLTASVKAMAERQAAENKAAILKETAKALDGGPGKVHVITDANGRTKNVVEYAAGIKEEVGKRSVVAQARSESSKFTIDDVKNIESTLDYDISSNPVKLHERFMSAKTDAERVAYTSIMAKRGAPGALNLREMATEMDRRFSQGLIDRTALNDYKELVLAQNPSIMNIGKDLEFYFTNASYGLDDPDPTLAGKIKTFSEIANAASTWGNLSADAFSRMNIINQMQGLRILAHKSPAKYRTLVENLKRSPSAMANMKDDVVQAIKRSADDPYWFKDKFNVPSRDELTEFEQHVLFESPRTEFNERDGYTQDADYWKKKYESQVAKTEKMFKDARARGIDYNTVPEHKPTD
ncbi:hypothetical protein HG445_002705 [Candidatus Saccharibacteria bacterium]|nr:hypothetical protein [Candidatus Saccharibacteria bacterium]